MKKGISPLIASVMLIAITVSAAILIMGWFSTLTQSSTSQVSNKTNEAVSCSSARISVDDVYVSAGLAGSARIIVKNSGFGALGVNGVQLFNKTGENFSTGFTPRVIDAGAIYTVYLDNVSITLCPADFSKVIVTSSCGGISAVFDGAPKCL